jgi:hypothetical protein
MAKLTVDMKRVVRCRPRLGWWRGRHFVPSRFIHLLMINFTIDWIRRWNFRNSNITLTL